MPANIGHFFEKVFFACLLLLENAAYREDLCDEHEKVRELMEANSVWLEVTDRTPPSQQGRRRGGGWFQKTALKTRLELLKRTAG